MVKKELLIRALECSKSDDVEGFLQEVLDVYLKSKDVEVKIQSDSLEGLNKAKQFYVMQWSNFKVTGYSLDDVNLVIECDSYFSPEEQVSLSNGYRLLRNQLIDQGIVQDNKFIKDYEFSSFSTAASVCRGSQMNGRREFKLKEVEEMNKGWLEVLKEALESLGGQGSLSEIYTKVEALYPEKSMGSFKDTIRGTIYRHASQSGYYQGGEDAFESYEKRSGIWKLR